jgi:hypothetical protein
MEAIYVGQGRLTIVSVIYGIGVHDLGSGREGSDDNALILDRKAFRVGACRTLVANIFIECLKGTCYRFMICR